MDYNSFWKIHCFTFFPYESIREQIWPCRKIGHGQPKVIIWTNLVVLIHLMMHTKFQSHQPFGSGRRFFKVFTIYGHGGHLGHVTWTIWTNFCSPSQGGSIWNLASTGPGFRGEMFENVDHTHIHTYGRQSPIYTISSPMSLWLWWAKYNHAFMLLYYWIYLTCWENQ